MRGSASHLDPLVEAAGGYGEHRGAGSVPVDIPAPEARTPH